MANSAFDHSPTITIPGSSTNTALVRWSSTGADTFLDSTLVLSTSATPTLGIAADPDLLTFGNGTIAITGAITGVTTITATTFSGTLSGNATGSAATLTNARTIGGVSFNGSANINLPGVNAVGSQNTTGSAATLTTARTIGGVSFNGSAAIVPATITVADTTDTSTFVGLWTDATGDLAPKTDAALTYNAGTGALSATTFHGSGANLTGISAGVDTTGTPADNQIAVFTDADTLEGRAELTHDGTNFLTKNTTGNNSYIIISHSSTTGGHQSGVYFKTNTTTNLKLDVTGDGHMTWRQGASETVAMVLAASQGGLGIGSGIDPDGLEAPLHVKYGGTDSGASFHARNSLIVERSNETGIAIGTRNSDSGFLDFAAPQSSYDGRIQYSQGGRYMNFYTSAAVEFIIQSNGDIHDSSGAIHSNSDERIKENIVDSAFGLAEVLQLRPVDFNFCSWYTNEEVNPLRTGFIAQEVKEIIPNVIKIKPHETPFDFTDPDGTPHHLHDPIPDIHSIQDQQLIPMLVKAIQELKAEIDALKE